MRFIALEGHGVTVEKVRFDESGVRTVADRYITNLVDY